MKLLFSNKSNKYIAGFLSIIFIANLFFWIPIQTKAYSVTVVADVSVTNIGTWTNTLAIAKAVTAIEVITAKNLIVDTELMGVTNEWATFDEGMSWWEKSVQWVKTSWFQISSLLNDKSSLLKEYVLDPLFWTMANVVIDQFGDAIVNWIQNGFEGSPMFMSDPEGFFRDTANQISGAIIDELNMEWLCDSLGKLRIDLDFFLPGTDRAKYRCTFNDIADNFKGISGRKDLSDWVDINVNVRQQNIVRLYGYDYRNGGLLMWLKTAGWKNNDLGRTLQVSSDAYIGARMSVGFGRFQLFKNGGFLTMRKCTDREGPVQEGQKGRCVKYEDTTPGQLVQDQLNNAANKDLGRLQVADEVNEIIGALASTMIGWMLTGGNDEGGLTGYDKNADYSSSNRDNFGALNESQTLTKKKTDISSQIVIIKNGNDQYNNALKNYMDVSGGAENSTGIILAKLKCIRATSTNDTADIYDDSACLGASEETKNVKLTPEQITEITVDINKIESDVGQNGEGKYDESEIAISARTAELLDEFENKVMATTVLEDIDVILEEYCYSYNEIAKVGTICGLYTDNKGNTKQETHETHSEEEANAINEEAGKVAVREISKETDYLCILKKYVPVKGLLDGQCKEFIKEQSSSSSSSSSVTFEE